MTHVVTDACIRCKYTDCVDVCPVDCFKEGPEFLVIDPDECIDCAVCIPECPVNAIYADADLPAEISSRPGFGTNGCHYAVERGVPTVIYGPSKRELVHRVDEFIEIQELIGACEGYYAMSGRLLSRTGTLFEARGTAPAILASGGR